jgi:hypothetical protein
MPTWNQLLLPVNCVNSCYLLARFVKRFYVKDCICENQRRNSMGSMKLVKLQPLKEYDIY